MRSRTVAALLPLSLILALAPGCDDCPSSPDMVTVSGLVRNIDTLELAEGLQVSLLDTEYRDAVPTGSDGAYSLQVPKGSVLYLTTDDPVGARADIWFPLINVDTHPPIIANADVTDLPIHACPYSSPPQLGSVAVWDNYLANGDSANGDMYPANSSAEAGAVIAGIVFGGANGAMIASADFTVTLGVADFPLGYVDITKIGDPMGAPDPSYGPDILFPASRTVTDESGWFFSFGAPGTHVREFTMTITDADPQRALDWGTPWVVPVRPHTISLVFPCFLDGVTNVPLGDWGRAVGLF